jgi:hypothetical protein
MFPVNIFVFQDKQLQHSINYSTQPWLFHAISSEAFSGKNCTILFYISVGNMHNFILYLTVNKTTDKLGRPIDEGIKELIVGLNIFGFQTTMSCFGHIRENKTLAIEHFALTPYVHIKPTLDKELEKELEDLRLKVSKARERHNKEEYRRAYKEWVSVKDNAATPYYSCIKQLIELFTEFYRERRVAYDAQFVVAGSLQRVRIKNIGEKYLYLMNLDTKKVKLKEYQAEFIAFGEFLKAKYFVALPPTP